VRSFFEKESHLMKTHTIAFMVVLALAAVVASLDGGQQSRAEIAALEDCKGNLRNLSTAMYMYRTDYRGNFPESFATLMPAYIEEVPQCPDAGTVTYRYETKIGTTGTASHPGRDYFRIHCAGQNHANLPADGPSYDSVSGYSEQGTIATEE
jgi:hypothetical protein